MSSTNQPVTKEPPASAAPDAPTGSASPPAQSPTARPAGESRDQADPATAPGVPPRVSPEAASGDGESSPASGQAAPVIPTEPDEVAAAAVEVARQAAEDVAEPNTVGEHLGVTVDTGGLTMHSFACTSRGYRGWRWAVTLAHVPGSDRVTVCDTVLLPGAESVLAPTWVPWSDRLAPGDLGPGDDLPYRADDPFLVPGYTVTDDGDADQVLFWELGLGRERVLGREGLTAAAERWEKGPHGPDSELAAQASAKCVTCAYFLPVAGSLRPYFGACANEWSPADGSVVTADFGCGAHSETDLELPAPEPLPEHILDETVVERVLIDRSETPAEDPASVVLEVVEPVADTELVAGSVVDQEPIEDVETPEVEAALAAEAEDPSTAPDASAEASADPPPAVEAPTVEGAVVETPAAEPTVAEPTVVEVALVEAALAADTEADAVPGSVFAQVTHEAPVEVVPGRDLERETAPADVDAADGSPIGEAPDVGVPAETPEPSEVEPAPDVEAALAADTEADAVPGSVFAQLTHEAPVEVVPGRGLEPETAPEAVDAPDVEAALAADTEADAVPGSVFAQVTHEAPVEVVPGRGLEPETAAEPEADGTDEAPPQP